MSTSNFIESNQVHPNLRTLSRAMLVPAGLGLALMSSGAAGLINQVVWQRALKVFLGGSETISSMIVVLVFMAGLGAGSIWMGRRAARVLDPLRSLMGVEFALFAVNAVICVLLASDLSASVFAVQSVALALSVPLWLVYAAGAVLILVVPCLLMGATMPLAAEVCQRRLGLHNPRVLGLLFFINTLGSVAGTVVASGWMIASLGQSRSLILAAGLNVLASVVLFFIARSIPQLLMPAQEPATARRPMAWRDFLRPTPEDVMALGLGFCSLAYEMYLLRLVAWRHQPLPFIFAAVLAGFLLFWSVGAYISSLRFEVSLSAALRAGALLCAGSIPMFVFDHDAEINGIAGIARFVLGHCPYFLPCVCFGFLFSRVAARAARSWGADVGRVYGWNTLGSCLGVVLTTFVGYEMPFFMMVLVIGLLMYTLQEFVDQRERTVPRHSRMPGWVLPAGGVLLAVGASFGMDLSGIMPGLRVYSGRDGVIGIDQEGNMIWDGLWHSKLSVNDDHVGTNNWYLAVCPVLSHGSGEIRDACVIGVATGITASTLARSDTVRRVDGYDITRTLQEIYERYPDGTLRVAENPKVRIIWQDARTGLALNPDRTYDLIQTQPLYLKQSGSSLLNSVEFYDLVSRRLKPGGVFCLYSNGTPEQAFVIRQTAAQVFPHRASFYAGYLLILSNDPIDLSTEALARRFERRDPLWDEIRACPTTRDPAAVRQMVDDPPLDWGDGRLVVTDDRPVVEYPAFVSRRMEELGYRIVAVPEQWAPQVQTHDPDLQPVQH
jgi:spermidine synthase